MNWLILLYFIELGYSPFYNSLNVLPTDYEYIRNENVFYIEFDAEIIVKYLFIGGSIRTYVQKNNTSNGFYPIQNDYEFRAGVRFEDIENHDIELAFKHGCIHPGDSYGVISYGKSYGGYEEISLRISN